MILNHRNNHFLQTDTTMHKIHTTAIHFDTNTFSRCKSIEFRISAQEFYRHQVIWLHTLLHNCIPSAILHTSLDTFFFCNVRVCYIHIKKTSFIYFVLFLQRTVIRIFVPPNSFTMIRTRFFNSEIALSHAAKTAVSEVWLASSMVSW